MNLNSSEVKILLGYFQDMSYVELKDSGLLPIMNKLNNSMDVFEFKDWHREVVNLLFNGKKIHAIKLVQEMTNYFIKSAKNICERVCDEMSKTSIHWQRVYSPNPIIYDHVFLTTEESRLVSILIKVASLDSLQ